MKFFVKKTSTGLIPVYNSDHESLKDCKLKLGEVYEVEIKKKRNYEFHKKYFALLNLCYENQEKFDNIDSLRGYLTIKAGYRKETDTGKGIYYEPESISFASMDNIEFEKFYQASILAVCDFLAIDEGDLLNEILNFM